LICSCPSRSSLPSITSTLALPSQRCAALALPVITTGASAPPSGTGTPWASAPLHKQSQAPGTVW
jgi:hypothetical protein